MSDQTKPGSPTPPGQNRAGRGPQIECAEFEALLMDVLDSDVLDHDAIDNEAMGAARQLSPAPQNRALKNNERFEAHRRACVVCGPLFADVQAGRQWLRALKLETVEPPAQLVHNILAATSGVVSTRPLSAAPGGRSTPFGERVREWWDSFATPVAAFVRQPRFVMSFGMVFFSFSLALNAAGVKPSDVARIDLRPAALRHAYNDAQIKVVKYYDNIRFVYEIESKVRELKRANTPAEPGPEYQKDEPRQNPKNDTSEQPEQRQDRNYSQEYGQPILAALRDGAAITPDLRDRAGDASPAVTVTTKGRFV